MPQVTVLVCGEPLRGDDAVAHAIADALGDRVPAITLRRVGGLMPDDLLAAPGPIVVVDAVHGPPPGSVVDLPLEEAPVAAVPASVASSHALPPASAIAIATRLGGRPHGRFIGVAGSGFALGSALSAEADASVQAAAERVARWVRRLASEGEEAAPCA